MAENLSLPSFFQFWATMVLEVNPMKLRCLKFSFITSLAYLASVASLAFVVVGCGGYAKKDPLAPVSVTVPAVEPGKDGKPLDVTQPITLKLLSPQEGEVVAGPDVSVSFSLANYELAPSGNHVHLILDNEPYIPWYDTSKPYVFKNVAPGPHVIRAFPSRPWHESWKYPESFSLVRFYVKEKKELAAFDLMKPYLTYSRPKGEYAGENAKKILLDFWLSNCTLSDNGYKVRYTLDGKSTLLTKWEPVWWEGLSPGLHTIVLELLDQDGNLVINGWNRTERTFVVKAGEAVPHH